MLKITLNGEPTLISDGTTVAVLLAGRALDRMPCAVEVNRAVVPKREHAEHQLHDGDTIEIVTLVGGG